MSVHLFTDKMCNASFTAERLYSAVIWRPWNFYWNCLQYGDRGYCWWREMLQNKIYTSNWLTIQIALNKQTLTKNLKNGWPTRWHLLYYILLNMFQTLIRPSSGTSEYLLCCVGWLEACWCYVAGLSVGDVVSECRLMDVLTSETCWAIYNKALCHLVGQPLFKYQDDARSNTHKIHCLQSLKICSLLQHICIFVMFNTHCSHFNIFVIGHCSACEI